jgi:membrane-associated phospholipid phosphatase
MAGLKSLFAIDKKPHGGLLVVEWVMMAYTAFTLLFMLFTWTSLQHPYTMLWERAQAIIMTLALWGVYRMVPCRFTHFCRIGGQLALLPTWYSDTFELNRTLPNLDHVFAQWEQTVMGGQPALSFAQDWSHPVFSELMHLGYSSYFPLIAAVVLYFFFVQYEQLGRTAFIILTSFFLFYVIFDLLPVSGPQYYYLAAGFDNIAHGVFPNLGHYFASHQESLPIPGWSDGVFYQLVSLAHETGERPTAAFPSSHVGVTTVLLLIAWYSGSRRLFFCLLPFFLLMCFATVYIQAHYAIDVAGGLVTGVIFFFVLRWAGRRIAY